MLQTIEKPAPFKMQLGCSERMKAKALISCEFNYPNW